MSARNYGILWTLYLAIAAVLWLAEVLDTVSGTIIGAAGLLLLLAGLVSIGSYVRQKAGALTVPVWVGFDPSCRPVRKSQREFISRWHLDITNY